MWYNSDHPNNNFLHLWIGKTKKTKDGHIFLNTKPYLAYVTQEFALLYSTSFLFEISSTSFVLGRLNFYVLFINLSWNSSGWYSDEWSSLLLIVQYVENSS